MIPVSFHPLLEKTQPYIVATRRVLPLLSRTPNGVEISDNQVIDPQLRQNAPFLKMLRRLDELTFAPLGMPMPEWVFYDCAVMPGAVFGLSVDSAELEPWVKAVMNVPMGYEGPVPVSMFIAIPMLERDSWFQYTLCDLNAVAPGAAPTGILQFTLGQGLRVFPAKRLYGTLQWRSPNVRAVSRIGALDLKTAFTPAHSYARTFTFRVDLTEACLRRVLLEQGGDGGVPLASHLLDADDELGLIQLQEKIEEGQKWEIVGAPIQRGAHTQIPLRRKAMGSEVEG